MFVKSSSEFRHVWKFAIFYYLSAVIEVTFANWQNLNVIREHIPMLLKHHSHLKEECLKDESCPYKDLLELDMCWGYENDCKNRFLPDFTKDCGSEAKEQRYWNQGDFGLLKTRLNEMLERQMCKSDNPSGSSLRCTKDSTLCVAKNLYFHLPTLAHAQDNMIIVPPEGVIGGFCEVDEDMVQRETNVKRSLSSWGIQLQSFKSIKFNPLDGDKVSCDLTITKPVVFVQLDATVNLYHHFCDFFNLYLTQLANNSWFGTDVQIIRWSAHSRFGDPFLDAWRAFTSNDILSLSHLVGKKVCIPDATFAFLPRMAYGLFYSTYLEWGCRGSRLIKSFSDHFLHRMGVTEYSRNSKVIRVTLLQRKAKENRQVFRRILNIDQLVAALNLLPNFQVKVVNYEFGMDFREQLQITRNSDIFIGMHGAGLTHFLFLPDWAVAFELYNCGDVRCYRDLAALRGLHYVTWLNDSKCTAHDRNLHERYGENPKFWNWSFDVDEFIVLATKARDLLLTSDRFRHLANHPTSDFRRGEL